jgi:hypothetical protein
LHVGKQRHVQKTNAARPTRVSKGRVSNKNKEFLDGIGEIMIDEHIIEPNKMVKKDHYGKQSR